MNFPEKLKHTELPNTHFPVCLQGSPKQLMAFGYTYSVTDRQHVGVVFTDWSNIRKPECWHIRIHSEHTKAFSLFLCSSIHLPFTHGWTNICKVGAGLFIESVIHVYLFLKIWFYCVSFISFVLLKWTRTYQCLANFLRTFVTDKLL